MIIIYIYILYIHIYIWYISEFILSSHINYILKLLNLSLFLTFLIPALATKPHLVGLEIPFLGVEKRHQLLFLLKIIYHHYILLLFLKLLLLLLLYTYIICILHICICKQIHTYTYICLSHYLKGFNHPKLVVQDFAGPSTVVPLVKVIVNFRIVFSMTVWAQKNVWKRGTMINLMIQPIKNNSQWPLSTKLGFARGSQ